MGASDLTDKLIVAAAGVNIVICLGLIGWLVWGPGCP